MSMNRRGLLPYIPLLRLQGKLLFGVTQSLLMAEMGNGPQAGSDRCVSWKSFLDLCTDLCNFIAPKPTNMIVCQVIS